jgi:membrane-associated protein
MHSHFIHHLLAQTGVAGILFILFCETGLFFGFFLPGGSLLFIGGLLASQAKMSLVELTLGSTGAVFLGYQVGYWFGVKFGHWLSHKKDTWYFKQDYLLKAHEFYVKHGFVAILVGKFIPIARTFIPIIAGIAEMPQKPFLVSNFLGSVIWVQVYIALGYFLGHRYSYLTNYITPILLGITVLTVISLTILWFKHKKKSH